MQIGIWGTSQAGKTTYLAFLYRAFLAEALRWEIFTNEEGRLFVEKAYAQIFTERIFPEKTVSSKIYEFNVTTRSAIPTEYGNIAAGSSFLFRFQDAPGELYEGFYNRDLRNSILPVQQRNTRDKSSDITPNDVFDYLKTSTALFIMIDPARIYSEQKLKPYWEYLLQLFEDLRAYRRAEQQAGRSTQAPYLAFCITKVDGNDDLWKNRDKPLDIEASLAQFLSSDFIRNSLPGLHPIERTKTFMISSIGRDKQELPNVSAGYTWLREKSLVPPKFDTAPEMANEIPLVLDNVPVDLSNRAFMPRSILNSDAIQSHNLLNPILWVLAKQQQEG